MSAGPGAAVRASGGLVIRGAHDRAEICLVHRPAYDDWTIPKGKDDDGETPAQAALREVHEETGLSCVITGPAGSATYEVAAGTKRVEYFLMRPTVFTGFTPNAEVDEILWVALAEAPGILTYDFDRRLVKKAKVRSATAFTALYLVRHGAAGDRSKWSGPDEERPLTKKGRAQAGVIADRLDQVGIEQVLSSPYVRCVETVTDLASRVDLTVEPHDALAEGPDRKSILGLLNEIAGTTAVLCSHGDVIPSTLEVLGRMGVRFLSEYACAKGSTWVITHDGNEYCDARYLPPEI